MHKTIILLLLLATVNSFAQNDLEGRTVVYDRLTKKYLCSVPEAWFDEGRVGQNDSLNFTFLPIVHIEGNFGYDFAEGKVSVFMPDGSSSQPDMKAKLKWRGGTTNASSKHKRSYSVKFLTEDGSKMDRKFFGLRKDNHWILDAAQVDMSRIRNRVATDIWNDFAAKPYYYDQEPKALTGTRGQFVELFLNDEYRGIYCMTECIDRSQMKLKKFTTAADGESIIHGQLWKAFDYTYTGFRNYTDYDNTSETWGGFELKYPELDDVNPTDWSTLYDAVKWTADNDFDDWDGTGDEKEYYDNVMSDIREHMADYFDMPVIKDYEVFIMLMNAIDNSNGKNTYWACYDKATDKKLTLGVWDFDATVGQNFNPKDRFPAIVGPTNIPTHNLIHVFLSYLRSPLDGEDKTFNEQVSDRYHELRKDIFSLDSLKSRYHAYMEMLRNSGAYAREAQRWSGDSDIGGEALDFDAEQAYIDKWLEERLAFLDNYLVYDGIEEVTADTPSRPQDDAIYDLQGRRITTPTKGIYIRNGKKYRP